MAKSLPMNFLVVNSSLSDQHADATSSPQLLSHDSTDPDEADQTHPGTCILFALYDIVDRVYFGHTGAEGLLALYTACQKLGAEPSLSIRDIESTLC